jgi:putative hemolysin
MLQEIIIVIILTLLNGFFSMSEIALVTIRKTRISELVKRGHRRAKIIEQLKQKPENLFATIQIGISMITIFTSAFAGVSISEDLAKILGKINIFLIAENSFAISFVIVVFCVSYISITIGELIPKSLGLRYAEPMALIAAYPIYWLSRASGWLIKILNITSNLFLRMFNDSTNFTESRLSEEEIRSLISEGRDAGTVEPHEYNIIENVFNFSDLSVDKIMIPRTSMTAININSSTKDIIYKAIESGYSRLPVYKDTVDNVVGILYTKKLLPKLSQNSENIEVKEFLVPPYFIPNTMKISDVLQRLQRNRAHIALVTDEHGSIVGLVTLEDVLEEIVGDISDETDELDLRIRKEGESYVVAGSVSIVDFNKYFKTNIPNQEDFSTMSGFVLEQLGRFPKEGDQIDYKNIKFKVKEVTARVVKSILVNRV